MSCIENRLSGSIGRGEYFGFVFFEPEGFGALDGSGVEGF